MSRPDLTSQLKNVSKKDIKQIKDAEEMLGPEPETMGFIKNIFWGNFRENMILIRKNLQTNVLDAMKCSKSLIHIFAPNTPP
jgi:hypothetical protein